jgi:hypothetical protein
MIEEWLRNKPFQDELMAAAPEARKAKAQEYGFALLDSEVTALNDYFDSFAQVAAGERQTSISNDLLARESKTACIG